MSLTACGKPNSDELFEPLNRMRLTHCVTSKDSDHKYNSLKEQQPLWIHELRDMRSMKDD